ncbi:MAG: 23S rRNA (pseudouridine(1915)-N(3))-methyltransferase RlmH [candidate division Zixibacteria bacterium]|nr:23S rRNA (pseudouridine(1915)-N(3))-methyltransferase RlmH [candidate division Zixibacteria bacterium]
MVKIRFIFLGRQKEKWIVEGVNHYQKLLGGMVDLDVKIIQPEKVTERSSVLNILDKEKNKIIKSLKDKTFLIVLDNEGKEVSSEELAQLLKDKVNQGRSDFTFVVGSSLGLSEDIKKMSDFKLSLSRMTFAHQLTWIVLLEQIYRAFSIIKGTKYHK